MNVLILQVFVSLMLVAGSVAAFIWSTRNRDAEHADRMSLAPLEDDAAPSEPRSRFPATEEP